MNISVETMKSIDSAQLRELGYTIENGTLHEASITDVNGCAVVSATVLFDHGGCTMGGNICGQFAPSSKQIRGCKFGFECLLWLMAVAGVENSSKLGGQYVRVAFGKDEKAEFIGHIVKDIWFSFEHLRQTALNEEAK